MGDRLSYAISQYNSDMPIHTIFFDLDGTLYPEQNGLWAAIKGRIDDYLLERMGFPPQEARIIRQGYLDRYGTTLRGLQLEHHIDTQDYLTFVHDLPLEHFIAPDPALEQMLLGIQRPKWIFTNSDNAHAERVLSILGIQNCFQGIIDIHRLDYLCKPDASAYFKALELVGGASTEGCLFIDDSQENLRTARQLGFYTVHINAFQIASIAHASLPSIHELPFRLPELWQREADSWDGGTYQNG